MHGRNGAGAAALRQQTACHPHARRLPRRPSRVCRRRRPCLVRQLQAIRGADSTFPDDRQAGRSRGGRRHAGSFAVSGIRDGNLYRRQQRALDDRATPRRHADPRAKPIVVVLRRLSDSSVPLVAPARAAGASVSRLALLPLKSPLRPGSATSHCRRRRSYPPTPHAPHRSGTGNAARPPSGRCPTAPRRRTVASRPLRRSSSG